MATAMQVSSHNGGSLNKVLGLQDVHIHVLVTEARVIVYCEKWTKSGGWIGFGVGGLAIALTANAISKARAAAKASCSSGTSATHGSLEWEGCRRTVGSPRIRFD